jgi:hypothetical protein
MQQVDLYSPIQATRKGPAPLILRATTQPADVYTAGGAMSAPPKNEIYILLSALPEELRRRVETAVQAIIAGM